MSSRTRFRSRIKPSPSGSANIKIGSYSLEQSPGNWVKFYDLMAPMEVPFAKAESCMDELHDGPPYRTGGPFRKITIEYAQPFGLSGVGEYITESPQSVSGYGYGRVKYSGGFCPPTYWPVSPAVNLNLLSGTGGLLSPDSPLVPNTTYLEGTVWDRSKPKLEQGGLAVAIAELRDVPRMLKTTAHGFYDIWKHLGGSLSSKTMSPKGAADHFLNHNFGWVPFIKDLTALCDNVIHVDSKIDKLMSDNGNWVRRRTILVNQSSESKIAAEQDWWATLCYPASTSYLQSAMIAKPSYEVWESRATYAVSVGKFRYYQPYLDARSPESLGALGALRRQLMLHGARISPSNVYKATPWTWLIDWVSDTGHIVSAVQDSALDGLAAQYLFLTHHEMRRTTLRQILPFGAASGGVRYLSWSRLFDVKQRKEASTPFGFGLHWDNLSPKQLAILAALGITRS